MTKMGALADAMIGFYAGDVKRIDHFSQVYGFAKAIGELEARCAHAGYPGGGAAILHDVGIKPSMEK